MGCLRLKKVLFIAALLLFCALPLFCQEYISVPKITLQKMLASEMSTLAKVALCEQELNKAETELTLSNNQINELRLYITELETALTELNKIHEQELKSLKASSQTKQIKTGFIVGGVCVVVTVAIAVPVTIFIYDKYFVK